MVSAHDYIALVNVGDAHIPDHDEAALGAFRAFTRWLKPDLGYIGGDMWGLPNFGVYKKRVDPLVRMRSGQEVGLARELIAHYIVGASCATEWHAGDSNHTDRLRNEICEKIPEVWTIPDIRDAASIPRLLGYRDLGVHYHDGLWYPRPWLGCFHGETANKWSTVTVRKVMIEKAGIAIAMHHTHRLGVSRVTLECGVLQGVECGHLGNNPPSYGGSMVEDWQQGFNVTWLHRRKPIGFFEPVPIEDGVAFWHGKEFTA